ncbi:hypothetical protein QCE63_17305 [Caballeronia sp. LZ065]|jgi:hypothetical protein|uniref:hypothetical protein n=1 Tax=unclassified Caballeronia TaxID=2646786 RepID=UPI00285E6D03|nr:MULTISPECIES: hypothetical protein [unclassified Caballeronia]MDR5781177.1 hypothetical protein [Caballeronia sp. LZ065]MDR5883569.1 hypothetical protein [Caballeronia sp. LZ032]
MSTETYVRNGHTVEITIDHDPTGQCTWAYTIDADGFTEMRDRPVENFDMAMEAAKTHANAKADALPANDVSE